MFHGYHSIFNIPIAFPMSGPEFSHSRERLRALAQVVLDEAARRGASACETDVSEGFGLSVTDLERVAFYLRGLEKKTVEPVREPQGAEGSAILIDTAHRAPDQ